MAGRHAEWYKRLAMQLESRLTGQTQQDALSTLARADAMTGVGTLAQNSGAVVGEDMF